MPSVVRLALVLAGLAVPARPVVAQEAVRIHMVNSYVASVNLGFARALRSGRDTLVGTLRRQPDGTWQGEVRAKVNFWQELKGPGINCPRTHFQIAQRLRMTARSASGFNPKSQSVSYRSGVASEFAVLAVSPDSVPRWSSGDPDCLTLHQDGAGNDLLPLNDGRWTPPASGYIIGLPQSGVLEYEDVSVQTSQGPGLSGTAPAEASARWIIRVERTG